MQPDDERNKNLQVPDRSTQPASAGSNDQAADYMRREIDRIYEIENEEVSEPESTPTLVKQPSQAADRNTYHREHSNHDAYTRKAADQAAYWRKYHSAWQKYYQQYYERYYEQQVSTDNAAATTAVDAIPADSAKQQTTVKPVQQKEELTRDQAVSELRSQLLGKVSKGANQARKSRHFAPVMAALSIALLVLLLQYNGLLIAQAKAYLSPGSIEPQNLIVGPTTDVKVGDEPLISIPKISVKAPVVYGVDSLKEGYIQNKLQAGVVHYPIPGADSVPGQNGNTVLIGHSSNDVFNSGDYKFIFVQLDELKKGDTFYLNYKGTRYTYEVTGKEVIEPDQINKLILGNDKPMATLITCTPPGTTWKRLIVYAKQISPDPTQAKSANDSKQSGAESLILPDNSPTLLERLFGG